VGAQPSSSLRRSTGLITAGGCLAVVFGTFVGSPATADFFRHLGANTFHFSLIGGVPMVMLSMHFLGALLANRLRHRKPAFMIIFIGGRLLYIPIALLPLVFPGIRPEVTVMIIVVLLGVHCAAGNIGSTLFGSWMADLIPHRILNRFWGGRQSWMAVTSAASLLAVAAFTAAWLDWPITVKFPALALLGVVAGVVDILLFVHVREPEHQTVRDIHPVHLLTEPIRDRTYRRFLLFQCIWRISTTIVGAFTAVYALTILAVPVAHVTLIWSLHVIGKAIASRFWGRVADRHGQTPIMKLCITLKPIYAMSYLIMTPQTVYWILPPVMLMDGMLNSGLALAENGYAMKMAPRKNRSMFLAAASGLAGLCAGLATVAVGAAVKPLEGHVLHWAGHTWNHFQIVFATSVVLRLFGNIYVRMVHEPTSTRSRQMLRDIWPLRFRLRSRLGTPVDDQ